jgi:hypothetical protein
MAATTVSIPPVAVTTITGWEKPRRIHALKIKAAKVPRFKPGKGLKDALN